jgi:hypothetical protein
MKKQILIGVGVLVALTGCTQHHYIEKQTVVPIDSVKTQPITKTTTTVIPAQNTIAIPNNQQRVIMAPNQAYRQAYPMPMQNRYAPQQPYGYAPQPAYNGQPMYNPYAQRPMPPKPEHKAQKEHKEEKPKVIRQYPKSDVNYDINKVYCCDFPVSYRKKKCTTCN